MNSGFKTKTEKQRSLMYKTTDTFNTFSKEKIKFLDILVHNDYSNRLQATLYKKPTDHQNYLYADCAHPLLLKKSIPCSQALRIKRVSSTFDEYKKHLMFWLNNLWKKGSKKT